jgi:hypothetical protein
MISQATPQQVLPLSVRRTVLLARIHAAREEMAAVATLVAADLQATDRTRRNLIGAWQVLKAGAVAAGVIWSFNAASKLGKGRRFVTMAFSMFSSVRAMRKIGALLVPLTQPTQRQESP